MKVPQANSRYLGVPERNPKENLKSKNFIEKVRPDFELMQDQSNFNGESNPHLQNDLSVSPNRLQRKGNKMGSINNPIIFSNAGRDQKDGNQKLNYYEEIKQHQMDRKPKD